MFNNVILYIDGNQHFIMELHQAEMRNYQVWIISYVSNGVEINGYAKTWKPE